MFERLNRSLKRLGPGFITGASDDDPSGIATYTQVGAQFGLAQLWTAAATLPVMIALQEMVGRIGMVTGEGLGAVLRRHYPRWLLMIFVFLLVIANTINIGVNLGAMADATRLLVPQIPFAALAIGYTVLILILEIFLTYKAYANILKWFAFSLLGYVITAFLVTTDWGEVLTHAVVPRIEFNREFLFGLIAVVGTTVAPYLFIWQASEEVEEEISHGRTTRARRKGATRAEIRDMRADTALGMTFSNTIMFFIIVTAAMTFYANGFRDIQTSAQAAQALEPLAGRFAALLYTLGIIGTGLLVVPVLSASASYAMSDAFQWSQGLYKKFRDAHGFYGVITISTLIGLLINFMGINPIRALIWTAYLNGVIAPAFILTILLVANNRKIMGRWVNAPLSFSNVLGVTIFLAMTGAAILHPFL